MGDDTVHWEGVGKIPTQGGLQADGTENLEGEGQDLSASPSEGRHGGSGFTGCGDLSIPPLEHSCTVHFNQAHYGTVSGNLESSGVTGGKKVVGARRLGIGRDVDGG